MNIEWLQFFYTPCIAPLPPINAAPRPLLTLTKTVEAKKITKVMKFRHNNNSMLYPVIEATVGV